MQNSTWQEDHQEFRMETIPYLQQEGKVIGAKARDGDETCKEIMRCYGMLYASFDPLSHHMLKQAIAVYKTETGA